MEVWIIDYEQWAKKKVEEELTAAIESLEKPEPIPLEQAPSYRKHTLLDIRTKQYVHYEREEESGVPYYTSGSSFFLFFIAILAFIVPSIDPQYSFTYLLGFGLLAALLTHSAIARIATLLFTGIYFLLFLFVGWLFNASEVFNFLFGVNTISLVPVLVGTTFSVIAMGTGVANGIAGKTKYAGVALMTLALVISLADTLFAVFIFEVADWWVIFLSHLIIYTVALLLAWGIFYLPLIVLRKSVLHFKKR